MPKNKGKGGKNRRRGKNENEQTKRELDLKEEGQEYGQVLKILGNGRVRVHCFDGKERLGNIRGKLRKKTWINANDIVLIGLRDFQDDKCDVLQKYLPDEARRLKAQKHIPENINIDDGGTNNEDNFIAFANENDDDRDLEENPDEAVPEQPNRYVDFSDIESSSEEEDDDEEDEDEEFEYQGNDFSKYNSSKKDFDIDNI